MTTGRNWATRAGPIMKSSLTSRRLRTTLAPGTSRLVRERGGLRGGGMNDKLRIHQNEIEEVKRCYSRRGFVREKSDRIIITKFIRLAQIGKGCKMHIGND